MLGGPTEVSNYDSYLQQSADKEQVQEYDFNIDYNQKSPDELIKSFHEEEMDENDLYEMSINNSIALNLYQSLCKLKKGTDPKIFKYPCQIKVYPKLKIMIIYLIVSHNFLRIKTELAVLRENPKFKKPDESELKKKIKSQSSKGSQSQDSNEIIESNDKEKEKEIIFTVELIDFYNMLDLLLSDNKDNMISISIDNNFSVMKGRAICPDVFNQTMFAIRLKYNLIKNEAFAYKINPSEDEKEKEKKMLSKNLGNEQDKDNEKNSDSDNIKINNIQSKSITQINYMNNNNESDYLEKRFTTDERCAKYIIEGSDLLELYHLMKGLESIYLDLSTHTIGISITNEKAIFFCLSYERIHDVKSFFHLSKNIKHITPLNVKSVKNHFLTPFKFGFNSFFRTSLLSKFITSFYNKDDRRLLIKVSPSGKMILSFTFSDPKNDINLNNNLNNNDESRLGISTEINENLNDYENNDENNNNNRARIRKIIRDRLLDDENRGNIVEMIFYPTVFYLCKS